VPARVFLVWRNRCHVKGVENQSRAKQVSPVFQSVRKYRCRMSDPTDQQLRSGQRATHCHADQRHALCQRKLLKILLRLLRDHIAKSHLNPFDAPQGTWLSSDTGPQVCRNGHAETCARLNSRRWLKLLRPWWTFGYQAVAYWNRYTRSGRSNAVGSGNGGEPDIAGNFNSAEATVYATSVSEGGVLKAGCGTTGASGATIGEQQTQLSSGRLAPCSPTPQGICKSRTAADSGPDEFIGAEGSNRS
jgi:hypothetical protein